MEQYGRTRDEKYCQSCGKTIPAQADICPACGTRVGYRSGGSYIDEHQRWLIVLLLCIFIGPLGLHRFYVGKIGTGVLMLLTAGGLGIWVIVDLIMIVMGKFTDAEGNRIY